MNGSNIHPTKYPSPGQCIYATAIPHEGKLTGEHIIPYSLNSDYEIYKASCPACSKITGKFEDDFTRKMYGPLRTYLVARSRRKHQRPKTIGHRIVKGEKAQVFELLPSEHPFSVIFFRLSRPSLFTNEGIRQNTPMEIVFFKSILDMIRPFNADHFTVAGAYSYAILSQVLAKIAHAIACAEIGTRAFYPLLIPLILGCEEATFFSLAGKYIGCADRNEHNVLSHNLHELTLETIQFNGKTYVIARIWLFAFITPIVYEVVVGETNTSAIEPRRVVVQRR
jgi:hypothetical protein